MGPEHRTTDVPDVVHLFPKEAAERALLRGDASIVEWTHADSSQEATALAELNGLLNASVEYILSGSSGEACRAVRRIFDATITHIGINLTSAGARAIARGVIHQVISRAPRLAAAPVHVDSVPIVTRRSDSPTQLRSARCRSASSLFRDRVGRRLSDYIGDRRFAKAKRPLDEGVSVTDVVERVGYLDSTSFIKKFKRSTGLTPGERHRR